ncbi:MAG: hypothetical protein SGARI_008194, partial [Bacillariaceae sp.]
VADPKKNNCIGATFNDNILCQQIVSATNGEVDVVSQSIYDNNATKFKYTYGATAENLYSFIQNACQGWGWQIGIIVVVCHTFEGSFQHHLGISNALRQRLSKPADALALQARQGAASQDPQAALHAVGVGYVPECQSMLICLPANGVKGALSSVFPLLKHALHLARGEKHHGHKRKHGHH